MIFRTLYRRLAVTLFVLLFLVGILLIQIIGRSSILYQQEVSQKLNSTLAQNIVADQPLMQNQQLNTVALDTLFHNLMIINPSIELYLLDEQGWILEYSAAQGKVKRDKVNLEPVFRFLQGNMQLPLKADDPRSVDRKKVFSVAEINSADGFQGYLYIVLGGEQYDDVVQMLGNSYIFGSALQVLLVALIAAMLAGLFVFGLQTRRLRLLGQVIRQYAGIKEPGDKLLGFPLAANSNDEIDELGQQFNLMAEKINSQIHELRSIDSMRREMVANVSHDLRTPLTTMRGYLETLLIKKSEISVDEHRQYIETALVHCEHLGNLVEELFELARLDSCESVVLAEAFSMGELVQDVTQTYLLRAEQKCIRLEAILNPDAPMIYGDIAMMQRVLENLLENALRYTPEGGRITIKVDIDSGNLVVMISDTGCGIPAEDVPRIFERFYQHDVNRSDHANAGLGLAIVKRILELHGSVIKVQSELNNGTTFFFRLATRPQHQG